MIMKYFKTNFFYKAINKLKAEGKILTHTIILIVKIMRRDKNDKL